jgi:hypothetical protein
VIQRDYPYQVVSGPAIEEEANHFFHCPECGTWIDCRRLDQLLCHEDWCTHSKNTTPMPGPPQRERQSELCEKLHEHILHNRRDRRHRCHLGLFRPSVTAKRELIDTGTDKRYVRRNKLGTSCGEPDDVGRSLAADRRQHAKTKVKSGQGDKVDRPRRKAASEGGAKPASRKGAARKSANAVWQAHFFSSGGEGEGQWDGCFPRSSIGPGAS